MKWLGALHYPAFHPLKETGAFSTSPRTSAYIISHGGDCKTKNGRHLPSPGDEGHPNEIFTISKGGTPEGVLMSIAEYESLLETLEILSDPELIRAIQLSEKELKAGKFVPLEKLKSE
ncbi:MAG: type II toxin-antitoxin system prevent-host-death family antitoxin [Candidatus Tritonobacter lacicola]|nr:type II toxin-antitoxin system prevent-host-death family antitoxin [Candidatus Tritonobacter lacicola]